MANIFGFVSYSKVSRKTKLGRLVDKHFTCPSQHMTMLSYWYLYIWKYYTYLAGGDSVTTNRLCNKLFCLYLQFYRLSNNTYGRTHALATKWWWSNCIMWSKHMVVALSLLADVINHWSTVQPILVVRVLLKLEIKTEIFSKDLIVFVCLHHYLQDKVIG